MSLRAGAVLGVYEIVSLVGRGAMGEVYRATDRRLHRDVAVKVLPETFRTDADRLRRFEQEALASARLNHPNILAVYDVGAAADIPYVVSELLEGSTLRTQLASGPLSVRKAIDYSVQIANGLAAAHAKGIIHRDLKPDNLFITSDGRVKILDFGLAKLAEPAADQSTARTIAVQSQAGTVVGTAAYMSPEQARGQAVDHRSDIFALGAILYEMLSGQRAFKGDTTADVISAVLHSDPPELSSARASIPASLDRAVQYCLEKSPDERFQSARDVALALQTSADSHATSGVLVGTPSSKRRRYARIAMLAVLAAVIAAAGFALGRGTDRTSLPTFQRLTFRRGAITSARFSPDGRSIIYAAAWDSDPLQLFITRPESPESRQVIAGPVDLLGVSRSAELAVLLGRRRSEPWVSTGTLGRSPMDGGTPRPVLNGVQCADWSPNGELAVVRDVNGGNRLELPIGHVIRDAGGYITHPRFSPSGDAIAYIDHPRRAADEGTIRIITTDGRDIASSRGWMSAWGLAWRNNGEVWFSGTKEGAARALYALDRSGRERPVARFAGIATLEDIASDGRALVRMVDQRLGIIAQVPGESRERDFSWFDFSAVRDLSADGKEMLFDETGDGGGPDYSVYVRATDGSPPIRLGDGGSFCFAGDTEHALWIARYRGPDKLGILPTGVGEATLLPSSGMTFQWANCVPGKKIVFAAVQQGRRPRLYLQDLNGGNPKPITEEGVTLLAHTTTVSPDGRSVVARAPDGRFAIYPIGGGSPSPLDKLPPDFVPSGFAPDSHTLYIYKPGELPARIFTFEPVSGKMQPFLELKVLDPAGVQFIRAPLIRLSGKAYAYSYLRELSDLYLVDGLK